MSKSTRVKHLTGVKHGWRSGLEESVGASLEARGADFEFETLKLKWTPPTKERTYTPDFIITTRSGKQIVVETKGRWVTADRHKMQVVIEQHPELDIRMVFQNPNAKIRKGSKTTYADWCEQKLGIPWAKGDVPDSWLEE